MARYAPIIAALAVVVLGFGWRLLLHRRRYGSTAVAALSAMTWRERIPEIVIAVLVMLLLLEVVAWTVWPRMLESFVVMRPRTPAGSLVVAIGLGLVARAQRDLGASWRIGIDRTARPGLVVNGLYRISRNPIYLGAFTILVGFVLLMPTPLSLFVLAGALLSVRPQVLSEEQYLAEVYGSEFRSYARRVGRFVPWVGRL